MIITSDGTSIVRAQEDAEYHDIVRGADIVTADGRGVVWMARVLGLAVTDRVSGVDMMERLCEVAARKGYSVYLIGAQPGVAEEAAEVMRTRYPALTVAGVAARVLRPGGRARRGAGHRRRQARHPLRRLRRAPPGEVDPHATMDDLGASVAIGVGGSFDVFAGRVARAPGWMQQAGLEWLWRVAEGAQTHHPPRGLAAAGSDDPPRRPAEEVGARVMNKESRLVLDEQALLELQEVLLDDDAPGALDFLRKHVVPCLPKAGTAPCDSTRLNPFLRKRDR